MKKLVIVLLLILLTLFGISGCNGSDSSEKSSDASSKSENSEASLADDASSDSSEDIKADDGKETGIDYEKITEDNILVGSEAIYLAARNDYKLLAKLSNDKELFDYVETKDGAMVALSTMYETSSGSIKTLYYVDENHVLKTISVPQEYGVGMVLDGFYNGMIYFKYYNVDFSEHYVAFYNPLNDSFSKDDRYTALDKRVSEIENHNTIDYSHSVVYQLTNYGKIYLMDVDNNNLDSYDENLNLLDSVHLDTYINNFTLINGDEAIASHIIMGPSSESGKEENWIVLVNLKDGTSKLLIDAVENHCTDVIKYVDDYLYFYAIEGGNRSGSQVHEFYRVKVSGENNSPEKLYTRKLNPMSTETYAYAGSVDGFNVIEDSYYVIDESNDSEVWFKGEFDGKAPSDTMVDDKNIKGIELGRAIVKDSGSQKKDGYDYYLYYEESFEFKNVKNADKLNAALKEHEEKNVENDNNNPNSQDEGISDEEFEYLKENNLAYETERTFNFVSMVGEKYISLSFNNYEYWGGAHGYGIDTCLLFDIDNAKIVTLKDVCPLSETELKEIVAKNSYEFWKENSEVFFEEPTFDEESDHHMYESFYEDASFDSNFEFTGDAAYIVYSPYQYGPYASGSIKIPISYEELKIN